MKMLMVRIGGLAYYMHRKNWTLAYVLYTKGKCKVMFFICRLIRTGCNIVIWCSDHLVEEFYKKSDY